MVIRAALHPHIYILINSAVGGKFPFAQTGLLQKILMLMLHTLALHNAFVLIEQQGSFISDVLNNECHVFVFYAEDCSLLELCKSLLTCSGNEFREQPPSCNVIKKIMTSCYVDKSVFSSQRIICTEFITDLTSPVLNLI